MNDSANQPDSPETMTHEEMMATLFAHMVIQNTNMALMFLGKMPNPQTNERMHDLEAARMFIDQLEMLEVKTKGNLSPEESKLLQQSLMHLRMSFVEVVEGGPQQPSATPADAAPQVPVSEPSSPAPAATESGAAEEAEPRKRFSKKF